MKASRSSAAAWIIAGLAVLVLTTNAWASFVLDIQVSDASGKHKTLTLDDWPGSWKELADQFRDHGKASWKWEGDMDVADGTGGQLGKITQLEIEFDQDPYVALGFTVIAGQEDQTYLIKSSVTAVNLTNPQAYASAGVTVTDNSPAGAAITGGFYTDDKIYEARYNGTSVFADLVSGFSFSGGTHTDSERKPPEPPVGGRTPISGTVSTISSEFHFTLSARDGASGTSSFSVIPEPATVGLLVAGGAAVLVRRRRRR